MHCGDARSIVSDYMACIVVRTRPHPYNPDPKNKHTAFPFFFLATRPHTTHCARFPPNLSLPKPFTAKSDGNQNPSSSIPDSSPPPNPLRWVGNIWASTGCSSEISGEYPHFPHSENCITNYCPDEGTCPDYLGPAGVCTKAEFALQEGGLDFYDVSIIDG